MDLRQYFRLLHAHWAVIAASVVICTAAAAALAWTRTPIYTASTQLFVSTGGASEPGQAYQVGLFTQQRVRSYAQIVSSPPVTQAVIQELGLRERTPELQSRIRASVPTDTVLIDVTVKDGSPERARAIADALGKRFPGFVDDVETPPGGSVSPVKVTVTRPAQLPTDPVSPNKALYLGLGALLGLMLGIGAAVLREAFDKRIRDEDDAKAIVGAPVLGSIARDKHARNRPLVVVEDPSSVRAEAYRRLRTNLRVLSVDNDLKSFVVSSAVASEGKTLVVANLGVAFAEAGYRVILVDAHLRRPRLSEMLGLSGTHGLTDVLEDELPVRAALQTWRHGVPLEVLSSGPPPPNPSEMLGSERFGTVLSILTESADVVILDAPALLPFTDAAILARMTSCLLLVTRVASTRVDQIEAAAQSLRAVDERVLGVVVNGVRARGDWPRLGSARPVHDTNRAGRPPVDAPLHAHAGHDA
jgi:polysaccharide biosynthesis transport protein